MLLDLGEHLADLLRRRRLPDGGPERARVQLAAVGEGLVRGVVLFAHAAPSRVVPGRDPHGVQPGDELANVRDPLLRVGQRNLRRDEGDAARPAHDAGRRAVRVLLDAAAARIGRRGVDACGFERRAVEIALVVYRLQHDRVGRGDAVELVERKSAGIVGKLLLGPATERHDPFAQRCGARARGEYFKRPFARGDAVQPQLVVLGRTDEMGVVVDEPRDHGLFLEVDHFRAAALELEHVGVVAHCDDALPPDRKPLCDRETVVDGDDLAVHQDGVGRVGGERRRRDRAQQQHSRGGDAGSRSFAFHCRSSVPLRCPPRQ